MVDSNESSVNQAKQGRKSPFPKAVGSARVDAPPPPLSGRSVKPSAKSTTNLKKPHQHPQTWLGGLFRVGRESQCR